MMKLKKEFPEQKKKIQLIHKDWESYWETVKDEKNTNLFEAVLSLHMAIYYMDKYLKEKSR